MTALLRVLTFEKPELGLINGLDYRQTVLGIAGVGRQPLAVFARVCVNRCRLEYLACYFQEGRMRAYWSARRALNSSGEVLRIFDLPSFGKCGAGIKSGFGA